MAANKGYKIGTMVALVAALAGGLMWYSSRPMSTERMFGKVRDGWGVVNCIGDKVRSSFAGKDGNLRFYKTSSDIQIGYRGSSVPASNITAVLADRSIGDYNDFLETLAGESKECTCSYSGYPIRQK